jgi:hypothetical protein
MSELFGITQEGIETALSIKDDYRNKRVITVPGEDTRILLPEYLMNAEIDLSAMEDPLPLALMAARDPEASMALAATARLSPRASRTELITGLYQVMGETTKHPLVRECVELVTENAFNPKVVSHIGHKARQLIIKTREEYTLALRHNLQALMEGLIAPREFVREFFDLAEAGNLRNDIRQKLILSLLLSEHIRPSTKFLMLEQFEKLSRPTRTAIISGVLQAEPTKHTEIIKEELRWIVSEERAETADSH